MYNFVDTICKKFGPRYSCSKEEKNANLWIKEELEKFCDNTFVDEFKTRPGLYPQGFIKIAGLLGGISLVFMPFKFPFPIISSVLVILGLLILYTELILMKGWVRFFFKKGTSSNAFGIIKPTKEVKFRIIFEGHTDSANEMRIASYERKPPLFKIILGLYYLAHTIIFSLWKFTALILHSSSIVLIEWWVFSLTILDIFYFVPLIVILPYFIWILRGFLGKTVVLGANDNLSASAVSVAIGKYLSENRPKNVEIWVGSQGSEEVGDRGAEAFVEKYGKLGILDNAYVVVLECCGAGEEILFPLKDMHRATYNIEIIKKLEEAHKRAREENPKILNRKRGKVKIGSCDACRYIHEGYKSAAIFAVNGGKNKPKYWHTVKDAPENIDKKVLKDFLEICLKFVDLVDKEFE